MVFVASISLSRVVVTICIPPAPFFFVSTSSVFNIAGQTSLERNISHSKAIAIDQGLHLYEFVDVNL